VRVREVPFSFPALALERKIVAFLEPEPLQFELDANGDGDVFDTILRVFWLVNGRAIELTHPAVLTADGAPLVNRRSVVVSEGGSSSGARKALQQRTRPSGQTSIPTVKETPEACMAIRRPFPLTPLRCVL